MTLQNIAINIFAAVLDALILNTYFNKMFTSKHARYSRYAYILSFALVEVIITILSIYYSNNYSDQKSFIMASVSLTSTFLLTLFFSATVFMRLFVVISFQVYIALAEYIAFITLNHFQPELYEAELLIADVLTDILTKIITFIIIIISILIVGFKPHKYNIKYSVLSLATPLTTVIFTVAFPLNFVSNRKSELLCIIVLIALAFINVINFYLLDNLIKNCMLSERIKHMELQVQYQSDNFQNLSASYKNIRRLLHDTKKHYFSMQSLIDSKEYSKLSTYLTESINDLEKTYITTNTGNLVIDTFLTNFKTLCNENNISYSSTLKLNEKDIPLSDYDFTIVLGNLLDNSLNACKKIADRQDISPEFSITLSSNKLHFLIHVENTFIPVAEKTDNLSHGYGIKNIENIVEKYKGIYSTKTEQNKYITNIIIPIRRDSYGANIRPQD